MMSAVRESALRNPEPMSGLEVRFGSMLLKKSLMSPASPPI
jgi:hypothetical protein